MAEGNSSGRNVVVAPHDRHSRSAFMRSEDTCICNGLGHSLNTAEPMFVGYK